MAIETLRNNSILEIIGSTGIKVVAETIDPGEANERKRFTISGKVKLNKAVNTLNKFLNEAFNLDGSFKDRIFNPVPSKWNCTYCPFANRKDLCKEGY